MTNFDEMIARRILELEQDVAEMKEIIADRYGISEDEEEEIVRREKEETEGD